MTKSVAICLVVLSTVTTSRGQLTQEQFTLNDEGKYHYTKSVPVAGATAESILLKAKKFFSDFSKNIEGSVWDQSNSKKGIVASVELKKPMQLMVDLTLSVEDGGYSLDVKGIEFYMQGWRPAEVVLRNKKPEFEQTRASILKGISDLLTAIEKATH